MVDVAHEIRHARVICYSAAIFITADCKSLATSKQWKTTIDLPHMNLIIFPASACPSSWFKHSGFQLFRLLVARLLQSAVVRATKLLSYHAAHRSCTCYLICPCITGTEYVAKISRKILRCCIYLGCYSW